MKLPGARVGEDNATTTSAGSGLTRVAKLTRFRGHPEAGNGANRDGDVQSALPAELWAADGGIDPIGANARATLARVQADRIISAASRSHPKGPISHSDGDNRPVRREAGAI